MFLLLRGRDKEKLLVAVYVSSVSSLNQVTVLSNGSISSFVTQTEGVSGRVDALHLELALSKENKRERETEEKDRKGRRRRIHVMCARERNRDGERRRRQL